MIQKLGRYELTRVLGKGAMGLVYEGRDPNLDRRVAIKTIKVENLSEEAAAEYEVRFRTEAHSAARLQHPNIVSVYDSDRDGDIAFMVMEFIEGEDLKHHLDKGTLYTLEQTIGIMRDLLSALEYAHGQSIVHRDIKPANLLIEKSGRAKLTDFGVARIQDSGEATRTQGTMVGTLKYMSPEQVQGRPVDARADIFAAGIVLYQLLTGKRPFDGPTDFATIQQIVGQAPVAPTIYNTQLPPAIDAVVSRALAKVREQRYATAEEFFAALQTASLDAADPTIAPPARERASGAAGVNGTFTGTLSRGEALVGTQPGSQAGLHSGGGSGQSTVTQEIELVYWKDIKDSADIEDLQGFMAKFPTGIYADLARRRLRQLGVVSADHSDVGFSVGTGTGTVVLPRQVAGYEPTVLLGKHPWPGSTRAPARPAEKHDDSQSTQFFDDAATTVFQGTGESSWAETQVASKWPGAVVPPEKKVATAQQAASAPPAKIFVAETSLVPPGRFPGPAKALTPVLPSSVPNPQRLAAIAVGAVLLLAAGFGVSRLTSSGPVAIAQGDAAAMVTEYKTPAAVNAPTVAAPTSLPAPALKAAAVSVLAAAGLAASAAPAATVAPDAAAARTPAELKADAKAEARAATKKAALEKEKVAKQAQALSAAAADSAAQAEAPAETAPVKRAAPAPAAAPGVVAAASSSPKQACEDRLLLGFQICMVEQCAKRAFTNHPLCVERRAMDERRRETEQSRR